MCQVFVLLAFCGAIGLVLIYAFTGLKIDSGDDCRRRLRTSPDRLCELPALAASR
jgi:hypothetical protein